jgi:hypothetical protein
MLSREEKYTGKHRHPDGAIRKRNEPGRPVVLDEKTGKPIKQLRQPWDKEDDD